MQSWPLFLQKQHTLTPVKIFQPDVAPIAYFTGVSDPKRGINNTTKMPHKNKKRTQTVQSSDTVSSLAL